MKAGLTKKKKIFTKGVFAILSVAVGLANGGQTDLSSCSSTARQRLKGAMASL